MKYLKSRVFFILLLSMIIKTYLITPIWNLNSTADDLLLNNNSTTIRLSNGGHVIVAENNKIVLEKQITRSNNKISTKNYYKIDNFDKKEISWEDIESFYQINAYFICPKGSYYLTQYINGNLNTSKPFDIKGNWELLCFRQLYTNRMFTFYLNSNITKIYYYIYWKGIEEGVDIHRSFLDLMWTVNPENNNEFPMVAITKKDNKIYISKLIIYLYENGGTNYKDVNHILLNDNLLNSEGYFNNKNRLFWITYNKTHLISGFSEKGISVYGELNCKLIKNDQSPFKFLDDITINYIKFIRNTKYIYYDIITNSNKKSYIGVIDIEFNKIIYNTENIFKSIKLYSNKGLLLETESTIFRECFSGKDENNDCYLECPSQQILVLDNINSNYCIDKSSEDYYILKPDNIQISNCNESLYIIQDKNECGLCQDLNKDKPYKIINEGECLEEKPENTYFIIEQLKILNYCHQSCKSCTSDNENDCLSCYTGFKLIDGKCVEMDCYPSCKVCEEESNDENNQHCLSCQNNKLYQTDKKNCIDKCLIGYYEEDNLCKKCHESCLTCEKNGTDEIPNCQSCEYNKYLTDDNLKCIDDCEINYYKNEEEKKCYKCSENCETCSKRSIDGNNYCLTCNQNSEYKYLLNISNTSNCVEKCPDSTILNEEINQCFELKKKIKDKNNKRKNIIILLIIILILCIIFIFIFCCYNKKRKNKIESELINKIKIELKNN